MFINTFQGHRSRYASTRAGLSQDYAGAVTEAQTYSYDPSRKNTPSSRGNSRAFTAFTLTS